ncbi:c-type cytochrome [Siphonobacter sp. SORGH_AS_1065]|uniref:c-type cytochrome n=1 Tax=Siphonobacter sp. SORGH_AS_1065 TaxID=3041795 RepID=UPI00277F0D91|nr:c-type cytochrome [Siphonobacter sp. SORGH_AS_1065]MDQ1090415.1 cytochrome c [Siphonobacter sp. SORGH_AS_1065]
MNIRFILVIGLFSSLPAAAQSKPPADVEKILQKHACLTCHQIDTRVVGPAYKEVARKKYKPEQIVALIHKPDPSHWPGYPPMSPMPQVPKEDALKVARWINSLTVSKK